MSSVKVSSAREAARDTAELRVVIDSAECRSSSSSASKSSGQGEEMNRSGSLSERRELPYRKLRGDGSRKSECSEPETGLSLPKVPKSYRILLARVECKGR